MLMRHLLLFLIWGSTNIVHAQKTDPATFAELKALQGKIHTQQQMLDRQGRELRALRRQQDGLQARLQTGTQRLDQRIQEVGSTAETSTKRLGILETRVGTRTLVLLSGLGAVGLGALGMFFSLRRKGQGFDLRLKEARFALDQETVKLDEKLVALLGNQMRLMENAGPTSTDDSPSKAPVDHAFAMRVGEEIHRMRQRLSALPEETKGLKPLLKSLERLEDDFTKQGYELVDLLNKPYVEEMTATARFIPSDDLNVGERVITRVIKPLILFRGVMVEMPEIEVSTGG